MVLAIDIGNTNIVIGIYEADRLQFVSRICTDPSKTAEEYAVLLSNILTLRGIEYETCEGAIISSVVPRLNQAIKNAIRKMAPVEALIVGPGIKTGINIKMDEPARTGADLISTAVGAATKYELPVIVVDLGTATKITTIDAQRNYNGGCIMPGIEIGLDALVGRTAQLPQISLEGDIKVIGKNTVDCMRSGVVLGAASMIDGMLTRYLDEIGEDATIVACGGIVNAIIPHCVHDIIVDEDLLLDGLYAIYQKNSAGAPS